MTTNLNAETRRTQSVAEMMTLEQLAESNSRRQAQITAGIKMENRVMMALIHHQKNELTATRLARHVQESGKSTVGDRIFLELNGGGLPKLEADAVAAMSKICRGNVREMAKKLKTSPATIYRKHKPLIASLCVILSICGFSSPAATNDALPFPKITAAALVPINYAVGFQWEVPLDPCRTNIALHWGGASHTYTNSMLVGIGTNFSFTLPAGKYFVALKSLGDGIALDYSNEVSFDLPRPVTNYVTVSLRAAGNLTGPRETLYTLTFTNPPGQKFFFTDIVNKNTP